MMRRPGRIEHIVVGLDFSPESTRALETAVVIARPFDAELHLVHAFDVPLPFVGPAEIAIPEATLTTFRDAAARKLEKARASVAAQGVRAETHLTEVPAAPALARVAREIGADLVVVGTRGLGRLAHVLLGSVAERTIRLAPCPVLTVRHGDPGDAPPA